MSIAHLTPPLGWLTPLAVSVQGGIWPYVLLFALVFAGGAGVPMIGTAAVGAAAVAASQKELSIDDVALVACVAAAVGGVLGYWIGHRWGLSLLERPGRYEERRRAALAKGHQLYGRWGWLACFMIPAYMAGIASMTFVLFLIFNSVAAIIYELATALPIYDAGRVASGHTDAPTIIGFVVGIGLVVLLGFLVIRRHRRSREHWLGAVRTP